MDADTLEYYEYEAARRNVSVDDVHREEVAARKWLDENQLTNAELKLLADSSRPDPRLLEIDEECPF